MSTLTKNTKQLLLFSFASMLCVNQTATAQWSDAQIQANYKKLQQQAALVKPNANKPVPASAASQFMVGNWKMVYTWIDENDNGQIDGKEKKMPPEISDYTTQYNADGTFGSAPTTGKRKGKYLTTNTWQWASTEDDDGGHIVWLQAIFGKNVSYFHVSKYGGSTFVVEFDRFTTIKSGKSTLDLKKPHKKSLYQKI